MQINKIFYMGIFIMSIQDLFNFNYLFIFFAPKLHVKTKQNN